MLSEALTYTVIVAKVLFVCQLLSCYDACDGDSSYMMYYWASFEPLFFNQCSL